MGTKDSAMKVRNMMNLIAYCDGTLSTLEIANKIGVPLWTLTETIARLKKEGLLVPVDL